jgi:hypothetical protein
MRIPLTACLGLYAIFIGHVFAVSANNLARPEPRVIHVFVPLADNQHQGIVPVPPKLGNGDDPVHNLFWGAGYGVKTFFARSSDWEMLPSPPNPKPEVLERCVFRHRTQNVYLVADAYQGSKIGQAVIDFLQAAAGAHPEEVSVREAARPATLHAGGAANLVAYIGHDGLMDFDLSSYPQGTGQNRREAIILACISKRFFAAPLRASGAHPLLWSTGLMAAEAYTLKCAIDGWVLREDDEKIRERAAAAYHQYQKCSLTAARRLLVTGW